MPSPENFNKDLKIIEVGREVWDKGPIPPTSSWWYYEINGTKYKYTEVLIDGTLNVLVKRMK